MQGRRVVITGMAALTSLGRDLDSFWQGICAGRSGISQIESFDTSRFKVHFAGEIKNFDPEPYVDGRERKRLDRFCQFAMVAAGTAVDDAGLRFDAEDPYRCGVIYGSGVGGLHELEEAHQKLATDPTRLSPLMIPRMMINAASGQISIRYHLKGPNSGVVAACASASNAIGDAFKAVQRGDADVMITGGSESVITPLGLGGFGAMRALSQRNDDPTKASRPFAIDRDGFVLSEGAGALVLEDIEHAEQRGAKIYAEVLGFGSTCDGMHITAPDPEGRGAASAMMIALRDARLNPADIDYINAHGTGTPLGDKAETIAVKRVFGSHARQLMLSSTKSQIGHLLGASGAVELVASTLALRDGVAPPTSNLDEPDPDCDLDFIPNCARQAILNYVMSNSFGFGGHNASLVLGRVGGPQRAGRMAA